MMDNSEMHEKTKKLFKQLNQFLFHVIAYFIFNALLTFYIFQNITERWGMFFIMFVWAILMIYHALRVYGVGSINGDDRKLSKLWSWV